MSELYVLSDSVLTPNETLFDSVFELVNSGVKIVQYRNKTRIHDLNSLSKISHLCDEFGAKFIINDDALLAKKVGAHGVHIGKDDGKLLSAREILGKKAIIGVSCYSDINLAIEAQKDGASYVAFGALFQSKTKPNAPLCEFETIKRARAILDVKIALIGGINASNLHIAKSLEPDFIAIVRAAYGPGSISDNIANLKQILEK